IELVQRALGQRLDRVIDPRAPTQDAEDESADEAGFVLEDDRRVRRFAFDAAQQMECAFALRHLRDAPTRQPAPRAKSEARCLDLPLRWTTRSSIAPSPVATATASLIARIVPGWPAPVVGATSITFRSPVKTPGHG